MKRVRIGKSSRVRASSCRSCGKLMDAATGLRDDVGKGGDPTPGAITVCWYCGHIMAFADDLSLRDLTDDEIKEVAGHPLLMLIQASRRPKMVSAITCQRLIEQSAGSLMMKSIVLDHVRRNLPRAPGDLFDAFKLSLALGALQAQLRPDQQNDFLATIEKTRSLDHLPIVRIGDEPVS